MPTGDAGLERQPVRLVVDLPRVGHRRGCPDGTESVHHACWSEDSGVVRVRKASRKEMAAVVYRLEAQLVAQQAVVEAAREALLCINADDPAGCHWSGDGCLDVLYKALRRLDKAQAAQPEGEQAR